MITDPSRPTGSALRERMIEDMFVRRFTEDRRRDYIRCVKRFAAFIGRSPESCRTAALDGHVEACEDCGHNRIAYNSCRNRHCPKCQGAAARDWLAAREADLLPVGYFHVVFTLPARSPTSPTTTRP